MGRQHLVRMGQAASRADRDPRGLSGGPRAMMVPLQHATIQAVDRPSDVAPGEMILDAADGLEAQLSRVREIAEHARQPVG